ncbi:MAG: ATP-binding protein [Nitrospira sp.]|nr:ATP-binding protein [Nitrospira sp.]MCP9461352.1 ATP-binding protein [Nitrospira sp.]MCP9474191.1 ATP-binding protein [Nitrospira sp.]
MTSLRDLISRFALMLMAWLLGFSALVYFANETLLHRFVDGRLLELAETLAGIIDRHPDILDNRGQDAGFPSDANLGIKEQRDLHGVVHSLRVFSPDGRLLWKSPNASAFPLISPRMLDRVLLERTVYETVAMPDGTPARRLFVSVTRQGVVRYVLQAETSLLHYQTALSELLVLLIISSGATLLVTWLGSLWLAKKVLTPIEALCAGAETMSEADLGKRLALDSPYTEFRRLTQAVNSVLDQFQRNSETQRNFCEIAAHEMKTPLTILRGNLEVALLKARTADEYRDVLLSNLEQVDRLIALTRPLLTLAKFTSSKPPVQLAPLEVEPFLHEIVQELALLANDRRITLSLDARAVPPILGDPQWLKQAMINLLDNALRYTPAGGTVTVRARAEGREVLIEVEDTGHGIEPEHIPHLFERFYRTEWAKAEDAAGTGLGLPIVKEIVEAHGGTISVTSRVGQGSVFTLRIPAYLQQTMLA